MTTAATATTYTTQQLQTQQQPQESGGSGNVIMQLASYLKNSIVKTVDSCGQLWTNHGKCKEIRQKIAKHREHVREQWDLKGLYQSETRSQLQKRLQQVQGGITFQEYVFLQQGKEDRGKVMNLVFLMWGAPRFLPYALMFNPDMLPSPFKQQQQQDAASDSSSFMVETPAQRIWRERSGIVLQTLADLERHAMSRTSTSFLAKLNIFGKKKQQEQHQKLVQVYQETKQALTPPTVRLTTDALVQKLAPLIYRPASLPAFSRAEERLVQVPRCIVQGLGRALTGQAVPGLLASLWQPHFLHRNKVVHHLRKVAEADEFLVHATIDLESISPRLLQEACRDRMLGGPDWTAAELRAGLQEWLRVAVREPSQVVASSSSSDDGTDQMHFNGNVMRMALMAFYGCQGARGVGRIEPTLPQMLLAKQEHSSGSPTGGNANSRSVSDDELSSSPSGGSSSNNNGNKGGFFGRRRKRDQESRP